MALEKLMKFMGAEVRYHRVVELQVNARDRNNPLLIIVITYYTNAEERQKDDSGSSNCIGEVKVQFSPSGISWEGKGMPLTTLENEEAKAAIESRIQQHLPDVYGALKLLPLYQGAADA